MGVRVLELSPTRVRLEAPLEPNVNHRSTAFGGSVAALLILAGWAMVHARLLAHGVRARTVVQSTDVQYAAPIDGTFTAIVDAPDAAEWERFTRTLERRGRARIDVDARAEAAVEVAATMRASYVALRDGTVAGAVSRAR